MLYEPPFIILPGPQKCEESAHYYRKRLQTLILEERLLLFASVIRSLPCSPQTIQGVWGIHSQCLATLC